MWCQLSSERSKYGFLLAIHPAFGMADVGAALWPSWLRIALTKFVCSAHDLEIETGRYLRPTVPRDQRFCKFCLSQGLQSLGNEKHVLDVCPQFVQERLSAWKEIRQAIPQCQFQDGNLLLLLQELDGFQNSARMKVWRSVVVFIDRIRRIRKQ